MPPFRIVVRHPDRSHHDHSWATVGGVYDTLEDLQEDLDQAGEHSPAAPASLPLEQRVRANTHDRLAEFDAFGYELKAQELVVKAEGLDDAGQTIAIEHKWKDV